MGGSSGLAIPEFEWVWKKKIRRRSCFGQVRGCAQGHSIRAGFSNDGTWILPGWPDNQILSCCAFDRFVDFSRRQRVEAVVMRFPRLLFRWTQAEGGSTIYRHITSDAIGAFVCFVPLLRGKCDRLCLLTIRGLIPKRSQS